MSNSPLKPDLQPSEDLTSTTLISPTLAELGESYTEEYNDPEQEEPATVLPIPSSSGEMGRLYRFYLMATGCMAALTASMQQACENGGRADTTSLMRSISSDLRKADALAKFPTYRQALRYATGKPGKSYLRIMEHYPSYPY